MIAKIILPLALDMHFSYAVPSDMENYVDIGHRVHIEFNRKNYTGIISALETSEKSGLKEILDILDDDPILTESNLKLWTWMAKYYCCTIGEVMRAAFPSAMRLQFDSAVHLQSNIPQNKLILSAEEQDLISALEQIEEINISDAISYFEKDKGIKIITRLIKEGYLSERTYSKKLTKTKMHSWVYLTAQYAHKINEAIELCKKSKHQTNAILAYFQLRQQKNEVRLDDWLNMFDNYKPAVKALLEKNVIFIEESLENRYEQINSNTDLSPSQEKANQEIKESFDLDKPALLHGVTGSGKTHIYTHLISEELELKKQCLYLLPEVALTTQLTRRLKEIFHDTVYVFNYRTSNSEKITIWNKLLSEQPILVLGTRSSIFLPFTRLNLIIVDEEHDPSYKQQDPNPRYNARDMAVFMSKHYKTKILLGTATPSIESYSNALNNKYQLINLNNRYGEIEMPTIEMIDMKKMYKRGTVKGIFSQTFLDGIEKTLQENRQVIIFQNRRGFNTTVSCNLCEWVSGCPNCDVTLTYHKFSAKLHCHQCSFIAKVPKKCPSCANILLKQQGYGTERIQEELKEYFPNFIIKRLDADTTKQKKSYENIIFDFGAQKIDMLVGTQMVSKGLDFNHVGLVAVLQGDQMLHFPDFRAVEYTYQMLTQVAGRAGRKNKTGRVLIQSFTPKHPVYGYIINGDYQAMYQQEISQRKQFYYPPFVRLIKFEIRHTKTDRLRTAVGIFIRLRSQILEQRSLGPATPQPSKLRSYYRRSFIIKIEKNQSMINRIKTELLELRDEIRRTKGLSQTRVIIEVDP